MELEAQELKTRLSIGELATHLNATQSIDVEDVIKAIKNPNVDNFQRAVDLLHKGYEERFNIIMDTALEQSAAVGEADLRRLKRQFSSLKNTFLHYEVKEEFIAALADGMPNGTEEVQLAQFEEEVNRNVQQLRALKANNEEAQQAMGQLIDELTANLQVLEQHRTQATGVLGKLRQEVEQHEAELASIPLPEELPEGPDEAQCHENMAVAAAETRELEAQIAQQLAEAAELEAAITAEKQEADLLKAQIADLKATREAQAQEQPLPVNTKYNDVLQWAERSTALISNLAGVSMEPATDTDELIFTLTTTYPTGPVAAGSLGPCATTNHTLKLMLNAQGLVQKVDLLSENNTVGVDIENIAALKNTKEGGHEVEYVVREIKAYLATTLHQQALFDDALKHFPSITRQQNTTTTGLDNNVVIAPLPKGGNAELRMTSSWPAGDDTIEIVSVQGASPADSSKAVKVAGLVLEGRGYVQGIEAVVRELAATAE